MECPECKKIGQISRVYPGIGRENTIYAPFYDKEGKCHVHPNEITVIYYCSKGHRWTQNEQKTCWCGWPKLTGD